MNKWSVPFRLLILCFVHQRSIPFKIHLLASHNLYHEELQRLSLHSDSKEKLTETKTTLPMHYAQSLNLVLHLLPACALTPPVSVLGPSLSLSYVLLFYLESPKSHPSSIPLLSARVCPWPSSPSASFCFRAVPLLELEVRHPPGNIDLLCCNRNSLESVFLQQRPLLCHRPTIPPPHRRYVAASWSMKLLPSGPRNPNDFHR